MYLNGKVHLIHDLYNINFYDRPAMKIILAPQAFKGTLNALDVCKAMQRGILQVEPTACIVVCPVGDGGDGTLEVISPYIEGSTRWVEVSDAFGEKITVPWVWSEKRRSAYLEIAKVCGLSSHKDPMTATTYGVGELITAILDEGVRSIVIGLGGSATNDGGAGIIQALGGSFYDGAMEPISRGGAALKYLRRIDISGLDPRVKECAFTVACDVDTPLLGPCGASLTYSYQKGATLEQAEELEKALCNYADVLRMQLHVDVSKMPYGGAAGGCAAGLSAFLGAKLLPGIDVVLDMIGFDGIIEKADLLITGEGMMDAQTLHNKTPIGVAKRALKRQIPVFAIVGCLGKGYEEVYKQGIEAVFALYASPKEVEDVLAMETRISSITEEIIRSFII